MMISYLGLGTKKHLTKNLECRFDSTASQKNIYVLVIKSANQIMYHLIIAWSSKKLSLCAWRALFENNRPRHLTSKRVMKKKGNLQIAHNGPDI